VRSMSWLYCL